MFCPQLEEQLDSARCSMKNSRRAFDLSVRRAYSSLTVPSTPKVTTLQGMNFPEFFSASTAARSPPRPVQPGCLFRSLQCRARLNRDILQNAVALA
jgi:hypothetical protein